MIAMRWKPYWVQLGSLELQPLPLAGLGGLVAGKHAFDGAQALAIGDRRLVAF
jgi:hypothetical protein